MSEELHSLLARQLRRCKLLGKDLTPEVEEFIKRVNDAYVQFDTDRQMLERSMEISSKEILEALKKAEDANQLKGMFVAKVSHELRTPLNGMLGMVQILLEDSLPQSVKESVEIVSISAKNLLHLTNDLLDFSKIEAGKLEFNPQPFDIRETIQNSEKFLSVMIENERIEMVSHVTDAVPRYLHGDEHRILQVLINLLSNAVKFNCRGGIIAYVDCQRLENQEARLEIAVADSGIGIPEGEQKKIYDAFSQVDGQYDRKYGGTGLGLSITKQLVDLMGGELQLKSKVGIGTRFSFSATLPVVEKHELEADLEKCPSNIVSDYENEAYRKLKILVAEDNKINQIVVKKMLERVGHEVLIAHDGEDAVKKCKNGQFDLILMDLQMPKLDGYQAVEQIRNNESLSGWARVPIVACTAHAMVEEKKHCFKAGMNGFVSKPIDAKSLFKEIAALMK